MQKSFSLKKVGTWFFHLFLFTQIFAEKPLFLKGVFDSSNSFGCKKASQDLLSNLETAEKNEDIASSTDEKEALLLYSLMHYHKDDIPKNCIDPLQQKMTKVCSSIYPFEIFARQHFINQSYHKIIDLPIAHAADESLHPETLMILGTSFDETQNIHHAERIFNLLEDKFSENEQIIFQIVLRLIKKNNFALAMSKLDNFLDSTNLRSKHALFYYLKASILAEVEKNYAKALDVIDKGLELCSENEKLLKLKLATTSLLGLENEALKCAERLIELTNDEELARKTVQAYLKQENFQKALEILDSLSIKDKNWNCLRFELLQKLDKTDQVCQELTKCIEESPGNLYLLSTLLEYLKRARKQQEILENLERIFAGKIQYCFARLAIADFCLQNRFYINALKIYSENLPLVKGNNLIHAKILTAQAKAHLKLGEQNIAKKLALQSLMKAKKMPHARNILAKIVRKEKNISKNNKLAELLSKMSIKNGTNLRAAKNGLVRKKIKAC